MRWIFAPILALSLAGCNAGALAPDPATVATVKAQAATAKAKAQATFDFICRNYQTADLSFDLAALTGYISADVAQAENSAVAVVAQICENPPRDANDALHAVELAWATVQQIRERFKR